MKNTKTPLTADQKQKLRSLSTRQFGVDVTSRIGRRQYLTQAARRAAQNAYRRFQVRPVGSEYGLFEMVDGRLRRTIMSGPEAACRSRQASLIRNLVTRAANDARSSLRIFFHDTGYGFNDELIGKALGEGLDTAGGYLVPAEHGKKPIELLRDGKSATAKAGAPTPPSGGKVQRQSASVTFDTAKLKADLWYGYTINYDFTTKAEVKQFMGQAQAAGFKLGATAQVLEAHARQEMGVPIGIDWQGTLARSKADMMKIAGRLNAEHSKNVMFKLVDSGTSLAHAKPSMAVYADQMNLGSVAFREHAQALYQLAKRIGSKVRSQNSSDMMPLSAVIRPTGKSVKAMPPLLPGGQGYSGKARASLRRAGAPPEEYIFHWTLEYEQAKEYTFQTAQEMKAFMATAKRAGYRIVQRAQPGEVGGQPADERSAVSYDRDLLATRFPMIKDRMTVGKGTTFIIEHHHGQGFRGFGMVKPPSGGPAKPTGIMINLKTEAGAKVMQSMAQAAGWQVKWR